MFNDQKNKNLAPRQGLEQVTLRFEVIGNPTEITNRTSYPIKAMFIECVLESCCII